MPDPVTPQAPLLLGFALGLRHALDADHLVAMATIVSRERSLLRAVAHGGIWGAGHCLSLLSVGAAVVLLGVPLPEALSHALELGVGAMLIGLGLASLRGRATAPEAAPASPPPSRRPFLVGVVHGLAGSGALAILVLATIRSPAMGLAYIALFGLGSIGGMMAMSGIMALPVIAASRRPGRATAWLANGAALASVAFGVYYVSIAY